MERKKYYLLASITLWDDLAIKGLPFPVGGVGESCGIVLSYDSLEKFQRDHPGKTPMFVETVPKPQERTL